MKTFKDADGHEWPVEITGYTIKRVLASSLRTRHEDMVNGQVVVSERAVDLGEPTIGSPSPLTRFMLDISFMVDLLYIVCDPDWKKLFPNWDEPDPPRAEQVELAFAKLLSGDVLQAAHSAFLEEWSDFSRSLGQSHKAKAILRQKAYLDEAVKVCEQAMESKAVVQRQKRDLEELLEQCCDLADSSATPTHSS